MTHACLPPFIASGFSMEVILPLRSFSWQTLLHSPKSQPMQLYSLVWVQHKSFNTLMDLILNDVFVNAKTVPTWLTIYPVLPLQSILCVWYNGVDPSRKYSSTEHPRYAQCLHLFIPPPIRECYNHPLFTTEETEVQRGYMTQGIAATVSLKISILLPASESHLTCNSEC